MVSGCNEQRPQLHSNEDQNLRQIKEVVERRHQRKKKRGWQRKKKTESRGGPKGETQLQKSIWQFNSKLCSEYLQNLLGADVWGAGRYANPRVDMTVEGVTYSDGKQANTTMEKEEMLRRDGFPSNDNDQYYKLPPVGIAHTLITKQAVERALHSQSVKKAPGPDMLPLAPYG
jgi:hypothetical protein